MLLGAAGAGCLAATLAAQTPPVSHAARGSTAEPLHESGPLGEVHAHVCGFHFYGGNMQRALRVHHYCSHVDTGIFQCIIYDSDESNARLIGIEYIISEALFTQLPEDEKKLWHSHRYEVMSGLLTAPNASAAAEQELMKELVSTYGKTWHLWQIDRGDKLPLGLPKLMMGFTADGQIDPQLVGARDRELGIDGSVVKAARAELPTRPIAAGADAWQYGPAFQINDDPPKLNPTTAGPRQPVGPGKTDTHDTGGADIGGPPRR
jgi:hypothetical protein